MSKPREFYVKGDISEGAICWKFVAKDGDFTLVQKSDYDKLKKHADDLAEALYALSLTADELVYDNPGVSFLSELTLACADAEQALNDYQNLLKNKE